MRKTHLEKEMNLLEFTMGARFYVFEKGEYRDRLKDQGKNGPACFPLTKIKKGPID